MIIRRLIAIILLLMFSVGAFAFWTSYEVGLKDLRDRPWIVVLCASTNEAMTQFQVVFDYENDYVYLDLRGENDAPLSCTLIRGEPIRRAIRQESAARCGFESVWKKGKATVYEFQASSKLLAKSKLQWESGPRTDDSGFPSMAGWSEWCYLSTLVHAGRNANDSGASNGSQPIRSQTNRTSGAAGSRR
jgi:hypothetical protein